MLWGGRSVLCRCKEMGFCDRGRDKENSLVEDRVKVLLLRGSSEQPSPVVYSGGCDEWAKLIVWDSCGLNLVAQ